MKKYEKQMMKDQDSIEYYNGGPNRSPQRNPNLYSSVSPKRRKL